MRFVDAKCPNCGGNVHLNSEKKIGICENCGSELSVATELTSRIARATDLLSQRNFIAAKKVLDEILLLDPNRREGYVGMLLCDLGIPAPRDLVNVGFDFSNNPNYLRALACSDERERNVLTTLCSMNQSRIKPPPTQSVVKTDLSPKAERFLKANTVKLKDSECTLIGLFLLADFETKDDKETLEIFKNYEPMMLEMIAAYHDLDDTEKGRIPFLDDREAKRAIALFEGMKKIVDARRSEENNLKASFRKQSEVRCMSLLSKLSDPYIKEFLVSWISFELILAYVTDLDIFPLSDKSNAALNALYDEFDSVEKAFYEIPDDYDEDWDVESVESDIKSIGDVYIESIKRQIEEDAEDKKPKKKQREMDETLGAIWDDYDGSIREQLTRLVNNNI